MFCKKLNRECWYYDICDWRKSYKINWLYKEHFSSQNIHKILFWLKLKPIIKRERIAIENVHKSVSNIWIDIPHEYWLCSILEWESFDEAYLKSWYVDLLIWHNKKDIKMFINYDTSDNFVKRVSWTWFLLWYPKCCIGCAVKMSLNIESLKKYENWEDDIFQNGGQCPLLWRAHKLYVHYPCSDKCIETINNSEKVLRYLEKKYWNAIVKYYFALDKDEI